MVKLKGREMGGNEIDRVNGTEKIEELMRKNGRKRSAMREMKRKKMGREIWWERMRERWKLMR